MRRVTSAFARVEPRGVLIRTKSRLLIPFCSASSGESYTNSSGCSSASHGSHRLMTPER